MTINLEERVGEVEGLTKAIANTCEGSDEHVILTALSINLKVLMDAMDRNHVQLGLHDATFIALIKPPKEQASE